jgi:hypothetical protein
MMFEERITRREALKKAAYMTPVIVTFLAAPSFASGGSGANERYEEYERGDEEYGSNGKGERRWLWNGETDAEGNRGNGKRGLRWLWDYEREERRDRKKHWMWW